jgi:hypothetical protein
MMKGMKRQTMQEKGREDEGDEEIDEARKGERG